MIKEIIISIILIVSASSVLGFTIREKFGDDVVFIPSETNTNYTINPDLELSNLSIAEDCLYINGNIFKFAGEEYAYIHLGQLMYKNALLIVTETNSVTTGYFGGYVFGEEYLIDISETDFLTVTPNQDGVISFTVQASIAEFIFITIREDVDLDGDIDIFDLNECWSSRNGNSPRFDVNNDMNIDVFDLSRIWVNRDY